jgi:hypothetical protein
MGTIAESPASYRSAALIATVLGVDKKTVHNRAKKEGWPLKQAGNRLEYLCPPEIDCLCELQAPIGKRKAARSAPAERVSFNSLSNPGTRQTVLLRERAVIAVGAFPGSKTEARANVVATFILKHPGFQISVRSLERWERAYAEQGIDGLVDQKQGKVGRRSVIDQVAAEHPEILETLLTRGKAVALDKQSIAAAARELSVHPSLPSKLRNHLHDAHASKSHVTPSIRAALRTSELTAALYQGPKTARLSGAFTVRDYSELKAGDVYTSDDMTCNAWVWIEWNNARGFIVIQPQLLPILDVRSLRWLNFRLIFREGGQYSSDDIWGLFGDVFDTFGMPRLGFLLEGGHWQANRVQGQKTDLTHHDRIGGLTSLGLTNFRAFDARGKAMIEGAFNILQRHVDAFPGYAGRDQRKQIPEKVKAALAAIKAGDHPSKYFPHARQYANHVQTVMENLNHERQDGNLRGASPIEQWALDNPERRMLPDEAKWLYRSAMTVTSVTSNGVRVTQGSGKKLQVYYFDNPELLVPLRGQKVVVFWNDHNPDADACICLPKAGGHYKFHGIAKAVHKLPAFSATPEQLQGEAARKKAAMVYARTELRSIQPELQRDPILIRADAPTTKVAEEIAAADSRVREEEAARAASKRRIRNVEVTEAAREAALEVEQVSESVSTTSADYERFSELFSDDEQPVPTSDEPTF